MNLFNRLLVIGLDLFAITLAAVLLLLLAGLPMTEQLVFLPSELMQWTGAADGRTRLLMILISAVVILGGLILLYFELRLMPAEKHLLIRSSELGDVTVAVGSIRQLASREASLVEGVMDAESQVSNQSGGLRIFSRVSVSPEANIVTLAREMQQRIKSTIEHHLGLLVAEVSVTTQLAPLNRRRNAVRRVR